MPFFYVTLTLTLQTFIWLDQLVSSLGTILKENDTQYLRDLMLPSGRPNSVHGHKQLIPRTRIDIVKH